MDKVLILIAMFALHVFADFHLQGWLANAKQKDWWKSQVPDLNHTMYKDDYRMALLAHSFEWSFIMMLPILYEIYYSVWGFERYAILAVSVYVALLLVNTFIHYKIDNLKANAKSINLIADQVVHIGQVVLTWVVFVATIAEFYC